MRHCSCDPKNPGQWVANNNKNDKMDPMDGVMGTRWNLTGSFLFPIHCATRIQNVIKQFKFESLKIWGNRQTLICFHAVGSCFLNGKKMCKQHNLIEETWSWLVIICDLVRKLNCWGSSLTSDKFRLYSQTPFSRLEQEQTKQSHLRRTRQGAFFFVVFFP